MAADCDRVGLELVSIDGDLPEGLGRIAVKKYPPIVAGLGDFAHRLDRSQDRVGELDASQTSILANQRGQLFWVDPAIGPAGNGLDLPTRLGKGLARTEDRLVFQGAEQGVGRWHAAQQSHDRQVVRFGAPTGEDDFEWLAAHQVRDALPGALQ